MRNDKGKLEKRSIWSYFVVVPIGAKMATILYVSIHFEPCFSLFAILCVCASISRPEIFPALLHDRLQKSLSLERLMAE